MSSKKVPDEPAEPPPPYSKSPEPGSSSQHLNVNIPVQARRSMEDETRPLPPGWVRQWDSQNSHQFFVDTKASPPRAIWHHPHDDERYLASLSSEERERLQEEENRRKRRSAADLTDDEADKAASPANPTFTAQDPEGSSGKQTFGRKWKDKLTGTTHEERQASRARRAQEEQEAYKAHLAMRSAMNRAMETGQPQYVGKDRQGHDIYVEPPSGPGYYGGRPGYRGYNPYGRGLYGDPNARFIRPADPYSRPYGGGYGGGLGLPLAGGLAGGLLLGGLLGGF